MRPAIAKLFIIHLFLELPVVSEMQVPTHGRMADTCRIGSKPSERELEGLSYGKCTVLRN